MNTDDDRSNMPPAASVGGVRTALVTVTILLALEALALIAVVAWLVIDLLTVEPSSYATAIALLVLVVLGAIWISAVAIGSLRRASWARASAIVWQVLQVSIAVGAFQGLFARPDVGWVLLVPAITVVGLLLWTPVRMAYTAPQNDERAPHGA